MALTNKQYDVLSQINKVGLPAVGTFYFTLSVIWGLPFGKEVVGTIVALVTLLGVFLAISASDYKKNGISTESKDEVVYYPSSQ